MFRSMTLPVKAWKRKINGVITLHLSTDSGTFDGVNQVKLIALIEHFYARSNGYKGAN